MINENQNGETAAKEQTAEMLNVQMAKELSNFYFYRGIAAWCDSVSLVGASKFFRKQADDEMTHHNKFYDFLLDSGNVVVLHPVPAATTEFDSLLDATSKALAREQQGWRDLQEIYDVALKVNDPEARVLLEWFLQEQVEEVRTFTNIYNRLKLGGPGLGELIVDREMAESV